VLTVNGICVAGLRNVDRSVVPFGRDDARAEIPVFI
jgi:hypothetical protein